MKHLVLAGGVALNCVANGRLLREGGFDDLWIQPAAGDAGGALGAALFVWHQLLERPRTPAGRDSQQGSFLGPRFTHRRRSAGSWPGRGGRGSDSRRGRAARPRRRAAGRRQGRRLVPGADGVRPPGPRGPEHPGRSPLAGDAGHHEPQDQVPRELPPVRPGRASASAPPSGSTSSRATRARTCSWSPRCARTAGSRSTPTPCGRCSTTPTSATGSTWSARRSPR